MATHCETEYNVSRFLYETGVKQYHADDIVPDDTIRCAATLYYKLGRMEEYENYKQQINVSVADEMMYMDKNSYYEKISTGLT